MEEDISKDNQFSKSEDIQLSDEIPDDIEKVEKVQNSKIIKEVKKIDLVEKPGRLKILEDNKIVKESDSSKTHPTNDTVEIQKKSKNRNKLNLEKSIDSFFVTSSGDNYLANVKNADSDSDNETSNPPKKQRFDHTEKTMSKSFEFSKESSVNKTEEKNLHPSWVAKQNMKNQKKVILGAQGNKIKFGDDDEPHQILSTPIVKYVKQGDTSDKLHPSWIAKQQQKVTIKEFQGTKIKFDD